MQTTHHMSARARKLGAALTAAVLGAAASITLGPLAFVGQASASQQASTGRAATGRAATGPRARDARTFSLNESGYLYLTSKHGFTLNEKGSAYGTVRGSIYVHLSIISSSHVTAEVNIYPSGGSITGYGSAAYYRGSQSASFYGSMSISAGSGSYNHAHGSGLSFTGTIKRSNDAVTVHVRGTGSD